MITTASKVVSSDSTCESLRSGLLLSGLDSFLRGEDEVLLAPLEAVEVLRECADCMELVDSFLEVENECLSDPFADCSTTTAEEVFLEKEDEDVALDVVVVKIPMSMATTRVRRPLRDRSSATKRKHNQKRCDTALPLKSCCV